MVESRENQRSRVCHRGRPHKQRSRDHTQYYLATQHRHCCMILASGQTEDIHGGVLDNDGEITIPYVTLN